MTSFKDNDKTRRKTTFHPYLHVNPGIVHEWRNIYFDVFDPRLGPPSGSLFNVLGCQYKILIMKRYRLLTTPRKVTINDNVYSFIRIFKANLSLLLLFWIYVENRFQIFYIVSFLIHAFRVPRYMCFIFLLFLIYLVKIWPLRRDISMLFSMKLVFYMRIDHMQT